MYIDFYGFEQRPFSLSPDPGFLFLSQQHADAIEALQAAIARKHPIVALIGEVGTGKTIVKLRLLKTMGDTFTVAHITSANDAYGDSPDWILNAFLQTRPGDKPDNSHLARDNLYHVLINYVKREKKSGKTAVLVIDEAQGLTVSGLHTLYKCSRALLEQGLDFQLLLFGQKELYDTLSNPKLAQLAQTICFIDHIKSLDLEGTRAYINHRIRHAGGNPELFTASAIESIFQQSGGIPRIINAHCETALIYGYREASPVINSAITTLVGADRQAEGLITGEWQAPRRVIMQPPGSGKLRQNPQSDNSETRKYNDHPDVKESMDEQRRRAGWMDAVSIVLIITLGTLLWFGRDQLFNASEPTRAAPTQDTSDTSDFAVLDG